MPNFSKLFSKSFFRDRELPRKKRGRAPLLLEVLEDRINPVTTPFTDLGATGIVNARLGAAVWGDYDNDGRVDILVTGQKDSSTVVAKLYHNDGSGVFTENLSAGLTAAYISSAAWGDYDNDGKLDLIINGSTAADFNAPRATKVYHNDGSGVFTEISAGLPGVNFGTVAWADFDNDGKLDILVNGSIDSTNNKITKIYRNLGSGSFSEISSGLPAAFAGAVAVGDYDNDGKLDVVITGTDTSGTAIAKVFRNTGSGVFTENLSAGLSPFINGSAQWGDYDNDGRLDLLFTGKNAALAPTTKLYRNTGSGTFSAISTGMANVYLGTTAFGDYDNDGDLDIFLTGYTGSAAVGKIYRNDGSGSFSEDSSAGITGVYAASASWGDYDNDGDLDLFVAGAISFTGGNLITATKLYRNNSSTANTAPAAPTNLQTVVNSGSVTFSWTGPTGDATPTAGMSYNLRVGTTPGGSDVFSTMANTTSGFRRIPSRGPIQGTSWTLTGLTPGTYYWSVQAIDTTLSGGAFASEATINTAFSEDTNISLPGVVNGSAAWGDYDNDGKLDFILTGSGSTKLYHNDGNGNFTVNTNVSLPGLAGSSVAWGDYDNDGKLDFILTGRISTLNYTSRVYHNDGNGSFSVDTNVTLPGVVQGSVSWGDYDNDGKLDFILTGRDSSFNYISRVYHNDGNGSFSNINASLPGVWYSSAAWGDYDNDGKLDLLLAGGNAGSPVAKLYHNNGNGSFSENANVSLPGVSASSVAWGDYDNDGKLDFLLTGVNSSGITFITKLYHNDGNGSFSENTGASLTGVGKGSVAWGDYDNDGKLDILLTGQSGIGTYVSKVYRNNGNGSFSDIGASLPGVRFSSAPWGDYDNDGDLDFILMGQGGASIAKVYQNNSSTANTAPASPTNLQATINSSTSVTFSWNGPTGDATPTAGMSYNLRVGTTPGGSDVFSTMASSPDGLRRIVDQGPIQGTSWTITGLSPGATLYWSVQAIDTTLSGGAFATEKSIALDNTPPTAAFGSGTPNPSTGANITFNLTITDPNFDASSLTVGDLSLVTTGNANGTIDLSGSGNNRTVTVSNLSGDGTIAVRLANGSIGDMAGNVLAAAVTSDNVTIDTENTAPVNTVPGNQTVIAGGSLQLSKANGNGISVSDSDAGAGNVTVNLGVSGGTLAVAINWGVTLSGTGTANLALTGTLANVNKTLDTLFYQAYSSTGAAIAPGNITLTLTTNDNGNSGSGGPKTDVDVVNLTVQSAASHVNVAPTANVPAGNQTITPATAFVFNDTAGNAISVGDIDAGYGTVQLTLTATQGRINFGTTIGLTFVSGTSNNSTNIVVRGRIDHINYNLQNLTYTSFNSFNGVDTLTVKIEDLGAAGTGGNKTDTKTVTLVGTPLPVNQPPVNTVPGAQVAVATKALLFSAANGNAITIADPDAGSRTVSVNLKVNVGTLAIAIAYGNVTYTGYSTNNLTLTGSIDNLNKTLGTLFYQASSAIGPDTLTITTNDLENFGSGGAKTDVDTVAINVQALASHVNVAPTITAPVATQNATMNGTFAFPTNTLRVGDVDASYDNVQVTLTVQHGVLAVTPLGAGGPTITGNNTNTITLVGRIDHIDYILQSLIYTPTSGYSGADTLGITVNDQGRNGTGGVKQATQNVNIQVA